MYLIRTTFKSPDGYDTKEEEFADNDEWLEKKITRIVKRWCAILNIPDIAKSRDLLKQIGLTIVVYEELSHDLPIQRGPFLVSFEEKPAK